MPLPRLGFGAAVSGGAVTDWRSYSGENGIESELPFFGATYYENPHAYDIASPVYYVKGATTPTLMMQGDADEEVPVTQPYEFWRALKAQGVPTRLRIFHGEGHGYSSVEDKAAFTSEAERWLSRYIAPF